jgi:hypothetical protein
VSNDEKQSAQSSFTRDSSKQTPIRFILFPALTMSLGWGLRGFIGGGSFGAMIPGAMVALALCLLLERDDAEAGLIAAFGAVGVGFGGQETYGQTVGFILNPERFWWGLAGLSLKGAVWGLLGGAILGAVLTPKRLSLRDTAVGLTLIPLATWLGWKFIDDPKLLYFSDPINKPKGEVWAGLLLGALGWLAWLALRRVGRIPWRFALFGMLGGGIGFGAGGAVMSLGHNVPIGPPWYDWWKVMELTFGFCFGAALGLCAWVCREQVRGSRRPEPPMAPAANPWLQFILAAILVFGAFNLGRVLHLRFNYTVLGVVLLWLALRWPRFAWHIAITLTFFAFARDLVLFAREREFGSPTVGWILAILASIAACGWIIHRLHRARPMTGWTFLFLMWSAVLVSWAKALLHPGPMRSGAVNETLFTVVAAVLTLFTCKGLPLRAAAPLLPPKGKDAGTDLLP